MIPSFPLFNVMLTFVWHSEFSRPYGSERLLRHKGKHTEWFYTNQFWLQFVPLSPQMFKGIRFGFSMYNLPYPLISIFCFLSFKFVYICSFAFGDIF